MYLPAIETRKVLHMHIHTYIQIKRTAATVENALPVQVRCHRVPFLVSHILEKSAMSLGQVEGEPFADLN